MTWIKTIPPEEADNALKKRYEEIYSLYPNEYKAEVYAVKNPYNESTDSVTHAHSLIPDAMQHAISTFGVLMADDLPLTRRQQEMIATVVSSLNRCFY